LGGWWLWREGVIEETQRYVSDSLYQATVDIGLIIDEVVLEGRQQVALEDIQTVTNRVIDEPILHVSLDEIQADLEAMQYIKSANVRRQLPNMLHITIQERRPIALWQYQKLFTLVDADGVLLESYDPIANKDSRYGELLLVVGKDAPQHTRTLINLLVGEPELAKKVQTAIRIGGRRWDIRMQGNVNIMLPEEHPEKAWSKLAKMHREHKLLDKDVISVDLRIPDRMFIKPAKKTSYSMSVKQDRIS
jgi:cell division protein FtsQ